MTSKVKLIVIGSGESFDPFLPNPCLLVEGSKNILIDCGYSALPAFWQYSEDREFLDAVLITHHHADHTFGLPNLMMSFKGMKVGAGIPPRKKPLTIIGPPETQEYVKALFRLAYHPEMSELSFPLQFYEISPGEDFEYGGFHIRTAQPGHFIPTLATKWEVDGEPLFGYSSDGKVTKELQSLFKNVPLLVSCTLAMPGGEGPLHSNIEDTMYLAAESGAKMLILVHQRADHRNQIEEYTRQQSIYKGEIMQPRNLVNIPLA